MYIMRDCENDEFHEIGETLGNHDQFVLEIKSTSHHIKLISI